MEDDKIPLFIPDVPDKKHLNQLFEEIWESKVFSNTGEKAQRLEKELQEYLNVPYISLYANATLALIAALQVMELKGEVITSPFTFIATTNAIIQAGLKPVFVDIDPVSMNLNPNLIEQAYCSKTSAIMPVHVYGNPCDVRAIEQVASKLKLPIIFDAAQAFAVKLDHESILNFGTLSIVSLHTTKVFSTIEGGFIATKCPEIKQRLDQHKNFGISGPSSISSYGFNAKLNEFQSAIGLVNLKSVKTNIENRKISYLLYKKLLKSANGIQIYPFKKTATLNYSYLPIVITNSEKICRNKLEIELLKNGVGCRKYFYPIVNRFKGMDVRKYRISENLNNAEKISEEVLCLPMFSNISEVQIKKVCSVIMRFLGKL